MAEIKIEPNGVSSSAAAGYAIEVQQYRQEIR